MIILGLDPGLAATGYGVVRKVGRDPECLDYGCVSTAPKQATAARLKTIYDCVLSVIQRWSPDVVVLEDLFAKGTAPSAALSIGQVRGVLLLAAGQCGRAVEGIPARSVKQAITGSGAADKSQLERSLRRLLKMSDRIRPDHAADALGLAYVGAVRA